MAASKKLTGWPDPWSPIDMGTAGALIGVSPDTIGRVAKRVAAGEKLPRVRNPLAIPVGTLFGEESPGSPILAERIYKMLKINPEQLTGPFITLPAARAAGTPSTPRRGVVPTQNDLAAKSDADLAGQLSQAVSKARGMDGRVPWKKIKSLADELTRRNKPPGGMIHGQPLANIDLKKVETWGFVGVFAAQAKPADYWPFVLPVKGGRPVDLFSASEKEIRCGYFVALTLEEWVILLQQALAQEMAIFEAKRERASLAKSSKKPVDVKPRIKVERV